MGKAKLNKNQLGRIIKESIKSVLKEADSYGWIVETHEAQEAYDMAAEYFGENEINAAIVRSLNDNELAEALAYIFRMWDFDEWNKRNEEEETEY